MDTCCNYRGIAISLAVAIKCLAVGSIVVLLAEERECGTRYGQECHENSIFCDDDFPCYCGASISFLHTQVHYSHYCREHERTLPTAGVVLASIFVILFFVSAVVASVQCIVTACNRSAAPTPSIGMVPIRAVT